MSDIVDCTTSFILSPDQYIDLETPAPAVEVLEDIST
jgi:hypothetical protein